MSEAALLQQILQQASRAAEKAAACEATIRGVHQRLDDHIADEEREFADNRACHEAHDTRIRSVEAGVTELRTTRDLASKAGGMAGRKNAAVIATAIIVIVEVAQQVYAAVAH